MEAKAGDRIRLIRMVDDPSPIEPGTTGTVQGVAKDPFRNQGTVLTVDWDVPRSLSLICPPDVYEVIDGKNEGGQTK